MKRFIIVFAVLLTVVIGKVTAQNEVDALRYSQFFYGGTARSLSMGSAFGGLGADFSALSINPAGIGLYKGSEFSITPSVFTGKTSTLYQNESFEDLKYNVNLNSVGLVLAFTPKSSSTSQLWKGVQFGVGVNRMNNFNKRIVIEGNNSVNSVLDDYLSNAQGLEPVDLNPFDTELAFNTYLLDTLGSLTNYFSAVPNGGTRQVKYIDMAGSINELVLALGANYNDKLYFGGTIGFPYVKYFENSTYTETDIADTIAGFKEFSINEDLESQGTGFNFKFGIIYRVADWVRIGAAIHTPTFYTLHDRYSKVINSEFDNSNKYESKSPDGSFDFELNTPLRVIGNIAFVISKYALISADYEFVDYSDARLRAKSYMFNHENAAINNNYTAQSNIRGGFEIRLAPICIRGGATYSTSPFRSNINDGSRISYGGGIGFREKGYFIDFAYVRSVASEDYYLYPSVPGATIIDLTDNQFLLTLGYKF